MRDEAADLFVARQAGAAARQHRDGVRVVVKDRRQVKGDAGVLGVQLGSWAGLRFGQRASAKWLKLLMAIVLLVIAAMMLARGSRS